MFMLLNILNISELLELELPWKLAGMIRQNRAEGGGSACFVNRSLTVVAVELLTCADDIIGRNVVAD